MCVCVYVDPTYHNKTPHFVSKQFWGALILIINLSFSVMSRLHMECSGDCRDTAKRLCESDSLRETDRYMCMLAYT